LISGNREMVRSINQGISGINAENFSIETVGTMAESFSRIEKGGIDVAIVDLFLQDSSGPETFQNLKAKFKDLPIVVLVEKKNEAMGFSCIDNGADAYLISEDVNVSLLSNSMKYAMERRVLLLEMEQYARELLTNEEYFRNLIASNVDSMVVYDKGGVIRFVNSAARSFFEKSEEQLVGSKFEYPSEPDKTLEINITHANGRNYIAEMRMVEIEWEREPANLASLRDITERKKAEEERIKLIKELQEAITKVKTLSGLLPICAVCKKIRDDSGYWNQIELYIEKYSTAEFSHGICPDCQEKLYGKMYPEKNRGNSPEKESDDKKENK
jgi:PAS domain-containing protein